jgi:hypothetical protein
MPAPKNEAPMKIDVEVRIRSRLKSLRDEQDKFQKEQQAKIDDKQTEFNRVQTELNNMVTFANQTMAGYTQSIKELEDLLHT